MRWLSIVFAMIAGLALATPPARAGDAPLTAQQEDAVKKLIGKYLAEHPEAVMDAIQALRDRQHQAVEAAAQKALIERREELIHDPNSEVIGNPDGDVTVVEFFDYHCPYCKAMLDTVLDTIKSDGKVRLVMKEYPILGPGSELAARAAIASRRQNRYKDFSIALMRFKGPLTEETVLQVAKQVGLDTAQLRKDMDDDAVQKVISANYDLGRALNIDGTPGWVVGDKILKTAMSPEAFRQLIESARKAKS